MRTLRNESVKRELIRTLIYSPQVIVGRQSLVNEEVLVRFAEKETEHLLELMDHARIAVLLARSNGAKGNAYEEQDLIDFLDHKPFPFKPEVNGEKVWRGILSQQGAKHLPYLRLNPRESSEVPARFTTLFVGLDADELAMDALFRDCLGREASMAECEEFRTFWREDVGDFAHYERRSRKTISRTSVYQEYIFSPLKSDTDYLKSRDKTEPGISSSLVDWRKKYQLVIKRITDLAYNANLPFTIGVKSFVPPDLPDPSALPGHIYQHVRIDNPEVEQQQEAVRAAWRAWTDVAADTSEFFFHKMQHRCVLADFGSFSLKDAVAVTNYPEWRAFAAAQRAVATFRSADELAILLGDYWKTISDLHDRLGREMERRGWRKVVTGTVAMGLSVTAHIMGHALLPAAVEESVPWWTTVATTTLLAKPIHAGLDLILHFTEEGTGRLVHEGGFKQGDLHEFTLSGEELAKLERLRAAEYKLDETARVEQGVAQQASDALATDG